MICGRFYVEKVENQLQVYTKITTKSEVVFVLKKTTKIRADVRT